MTLRIDLDQITYEMYTEAVATSMAVDTEALRRVYLFSGLIEHALATLVATMRVQLGEGDRLFDYGQPANYGSASIKRVLSKGIRNRRHPRKN